MLFVPHVSDLADWFEVSLYITAYGALCLPFPHPFYPPCPAPELCSGPYHPSLPSPGQEWRVTLLTSELDCSEVFSIMIWLQ